MAKQITLTFRDHVYAKYISNFTGNRSAFVEEMFLLGVDTAADYEPGLKLKVIELLKANRDLSEEIRNLKAKIARSERKTDLFGAGNLAIISDDDRAAFIKRIMEDRQYKKYWRDTVNLLDKNPGYLDGRFKFYKLEFGPFDLRINYYNALLAIYREWEKSNSQN